MKLFLFICVCACFLYQPLVVTAQDSSASPAIESIQILADKSSAEKVIIKLNGSYTPRSFRLDGERPRLVLDFYGVRYRSDTHNMDGAGGNIVAGVRTGRHNNPLKTRVVVDILQGTQYEYEQSFNVSNNSLEIAFFPGFPEKQDGTAQQHIQVGNAKIVRQVPSVEDNQDTLQEKTEPKEEDTKQEPASETDDAKDVSGLPADVKKEEPPAGQTADDQKMSQDLAEDVNENPVAAVDTTITSDTSSSDEYDAQDPEDKGAPEILDVSFEHSINSSETVIFKLSHFYPPLVFGIEKGEPRVVCDFLDATVSPDILPVIDAGGKYVNRITVSSLTEPDKIRIELELVPNHHYDLQQLFFKEDNLFVVIVNELDDDDKVAN